MVAGPPIEFQVEPGKLLTSQPLRPLPMERLTFCCVALLFSAMAYAANAASSVRTEIEMLLRDLERSGCAFGRNGEWYSAKDASVHLLRKLSFLETHGGISSTEQFIALGASQSSSTGQPYLVKCGSAPTTPSGPWLSARLRQIRTVPGALLPSSAPER